MAQNDRPNPPQNRANLGSRNTTPTPAAPPPPSQQQAQREEAQKREAQERQQAQGNKQSFYFRSSQPSTNLYPPRKEPIRFRNNSFQTDDPEVAEWLRKEFKTKRANTPLQIEEISESDAKQAQERRDDPDAPLRDMGVRRTNADGVEIVQPVVTAIPGQNMMVYPQPPLNQPVPTPGPHIAPEVSTDPADKGALRHVVNPVTTQADPGPDESSTLRPQDHPNVPAEMKEEPSIDPSPRPAGASVRPEDQK